jgi:hypothetical protein
MEAAAALLNLLPAKQADGFDGITREVDGHKFYIPFRELNIDEMQQVILSKFDTTS